MAKYTFKRTNPDGETEVRDFEIPFADYDAQKKTLESEGWVRVLIPVAVKDSGSGRD
jgi:hypothetical protein